MYRPKTQPITDELPIENRIQKLGVLYCITREKRFFSVALHSSTNVVDTSLKMSWPTMTAGVGRFTTSRNYQRMIR